jgi:hypothetical protein
MLYEKLVSMAVPLVDAFREDMRLNLPQTDSAETS